MKILPLIES